MASTNKKNEITEKESKVLALAWLCFKTQPEIDNEKLAKLAGYQNPKSVSNVICSVKKKIAALASAEDDNGGEGPSMLTNRASKAKPKAPKAASRKRKAARDDEGDSSDLVTPTPSKRARGKKAVASKATVKADDSEPDNKANVKQDVAEEEQESLEDVVD
ncbi:hypothetical protein F4804DRAFT_59397 [Jackrogersella minutella]|nr:hypothetical protein F4804DRAFT_59397 [Jackrogersella minutella]